MILGRKGNPPQVFSPMGTKNNPPEVFPRNIDKLIDKMNKMLKILFKLLGTVHKFRVSKAFQKSQDIYAFQTFIIHQKESKQEKRVFEILKFVNIFCPTRSV